MRSLSVLILLLISLASARPANAIPLSSDCESIRKSWTASVESLVTHVGVIYQYDDNGKLIEKDQRATLKDLKGPHITESLKARLRINSGFVYCKSEDPNNKLSTGSGFLYGRGGMQLITALHVIQTNEGTLMPNCWYRTREGQSQKVELDLSPDGIHPFTTKSTEDDYTADMVAIRLKQPVKGANPFPLDGTKSYARERLLTVAASQKDRPDLDPNDLVAQLCHAIDMSFRGSTTQPITNTDCSDSGGGSGGSNLAYRNGRWVNVSVTTRSGRYSDGNKPYSLAGSNFTQSIAFDAENLAILDKFSGESQSSATK